MADRERKNELKIYLSDDERYILEQKVKAFGMKSKSAFVHALKTAIHEAVNCNKNPAEHNIEADFFLQII